MEKKDWLWKKIFFYFIPSKSILLFLGLAIGFEILLSQCLYTYLPKTYFFETYLKQNSYQSFQPVTQFLRGELYIVVDGRYGWINRPHATYRNIEFDQYGSRSHHGISNDSREKTRIILLGDSRINGGPWVENSETINAYLDGESIETLNFGSPDYCLDQLYLMMKHVDEKFHPEVYVVGIDSNPGRMLNSHFLPFYDLSILPRLKPKYDYSSSTLNPMIPPYKQLLRNFPNNQNLLTFLQNHDGLYSKFERYLQMRIWRQTPILKIINNFNVKFEKIMYEPNTKQVVENRNYVQRLFHAFQEFVNQQNRELIVVLFASRYEVSNPSSAYQDAITLLQEENIQTIDTQSLFKKYRGDTLELYADEIHCTSLGNQRIAQAIQNRITENLNEKE